MVDIDGQDRARNLIEALVKCRSALDTGARMAQTIGDPAERDEITNAFLDTSRKLEGPMQEILQAYPDLNPDPLG